MQSIFGEFCALRERHSVLMEQLRGGRDDQLRVEFLFRIADGLLPVSRYERRELLVLRLDPYTEVGFKGL